MMLRQQGVICVRTAGIAVDTAVRREVGVIGAHADPREVLGEGRVTSAQTIKD